MEAPAGPGGPKRASTPGHGRRWRMGSHLDASRDVTGRQCDGRLAASRRRFPSPCSALPSAFRPICCGNAYEAISAKREMSGRPLGSACPRWPVRSVHPTIPYHEATTRSPRPSICTLGKNGLLFLLASSVFVRRKLSFFRKGRQNGHVQWLRNILPSC